MQDVERKEHRGGEGDDDDGAKDLGARPQSSVQAPPFGGQEALVVCVPPSQGDLGGVEGSRTPAPAAAPRESQGADARDGDEGHQCGDEGMGGLLLDVGGVIFCFRGFFFFQRFRRGFFGGDFFAKGVSAGCGEAEADEGRDFRPFARWEGAGVERERRKRHIDECFGKSTRTDFGLDGATTTTKST